MTTKTRVRAGAWRSRWAALGAAVAVTLGAGSMVAVNAASSDPSSFVSITPTRILDTRTDVGLAGPFLSRVSQTLQVTGIVATQPPNNAPGVNAEVVPVTALSVVFNVTVVAPSTKGFLSIRPGDASGDPATSNINWAAGGANIANSVTVQLPTSGNIDIFVNGTVGHVLIDVAGYYVPATSGPAGEDGAPGLQGDPGPRGFSAWDVMPSGVTIDGYVNWNWGEAVADNEFYFNSVDFPAVLPASPTAVNFAADSSSTTTDDDASCVGSVSAPTAPPGQVCVYRDVSGGFDGISASNLGGPFANTRAFGIGMFTQGVGSTGFLGFSWAYTAP